MRSGLFTIGTIGMGIIFGVPYWLVALAMVIDAILIVLGLEHFPK